MNALTKWHDFLQGVNTQSDNCTKCLHYTHPGHLTFTQYWHTDKSCSSSFFFSCPVGLFFMSSSPLFNYLFSPFSAFFLLSVTRPSTCQQLLFFISLSQPEWLPVSGGSTSVRLKWSSTDVEIDVALTMIGWVKVKQHSAYLCVSDFDRKEQ